MPYEIRETDGKHCIYMEGEDKPIVCHDSRDAAEEAMQEMMAREGEHDGDMKDCADPGEERRDAAKATAPALPTAIKALDDSGRVGGYLVTWGDEARKDLQGEYFTPETDLGLDWYPRRPALYHHGLDGTLKGTMIGQIDTLRADDTGVWAEAQLDMHNRYARAVLEMVNRGALGWSSGSLPQLVSVAKSGEILRWPIVEGSLTPTPAEPRQPSIVPVKHLADAATVKSAYKSANIGTLDALKLDDAIEGATGQGRDRGAGGTDGAQTHHSDTQSDDKEAMKMADTVLTLEQVRAEWQRLEQEKEAAREQEDLKVKAARVDALEQQVKTLEAAKAAPQQEPARRLPGSTGEDQTDPAFAGKAQRQPLITVGSKFDRCSAQDLAFGLELITHPHGPEGKQRMGQVSEQYANALAAKAWAAGLRPVKADGTAYKADELSHSTLASYGDEWVPDLWSSSVWEKARQDNVILPLFQTVEMPSNPFELPIQSTDPTVYFVPETTQESELTIGGSGNTIPDSRVGSGKVTLTAKKLALRVGFSSELVEDSIIPVLSIYREQANRAIADAIDNVLLNGDTTNAATGNINLDDADPADTAKYLAFDGLRHLALVTTTANGVDASGTPTVALLRQARFTMAPKYSVRPSNLAWIVDSSTYAKMLGLDEVMTVDKFGPQATILNGQLAQVDGIPVLVSAEAPLTEADGKVSNTGGNNTKGQAVCVYKPGWMVGYRRRVTATMDYLPYYDSYQLICTVRIAFINFDADVASVLYDLTV